MDRITKLTEDQLKYYKRIRDYYDNYMSNFKDSIDVGSIEARIETLRKTWANYQSVDTEIQSLKNQQTANAAYFTQENFAIDVVEDIFTITLGKFYNEKDKLTRAPIQLQPARLNASIVEHTAPRKLPAVPIPKFNGEYKNWIFFRDLFSDLIVKSTALSSTEKLAFLKDSLSNEPLAMIANVTVADGQFERDAWSKLLNYYDNNKNIIYFYANNLLNLKGMNAENDVQLRKLVNETTDTMTSLKALGSPVHQWDHLTVPMTVSRLDDNTKKEWETSLGNSSLPPTHKTLMEFLNKKLRVLESCSTSSLLAGKHSQKAIQLKTVKSHNINKSNFKSKCSLCKNEHFILACPDFKSKSAIEKLKCVKTNNLCFNCLGDHPARNCKNTKRCMKCKRKHHTSLHDSFQSTETETAAQTLPIGQFDANASEGNASSSVHSAVSQHNEGDRQLVLLGTALVKVIASSGETFRVRALVDPGSEVSLISESLVGSLRLNRHKASTSVCGVGSKVTVTKGMTTFTLFSNINDEVSYQVNAFIMSKLSSYLPKCTNSPSSWSFIKGLPLADPSFCSNTRIDILLGADIYPLIIQEGLSKGQVNEPVAQSTSLGWILTCSIGSYNSTCSSQHVSSRSIEFIDDLLTKFWEVESVPEPHSTLLMSPDERQCEQHFLDTYSRDQAGKFTVRLPFKYNNLNFSGSLSVAKRCFLGLEKKFAANNELRIAYVKFMDEYQILNHMQPSNPTKPVDTPDSYYIPHHAVFKDKKLRVVFNASSKTNTYASLNECLHAGPALQTNLVMVILDWRFFQYVYTADIAKMYRQIRLHPSDRKFQRIVWRSSPLLELESKDLSTITYGVISSAYQALKCIEVLAQSEVKRYPIASKVVRRNRYVDDLLFGEDSLEKARELANDVSNLLMQGGFPLRKWNANHPELLSQIPKEWFSDQIKSLSTEDNVQKLLGLSWSAKSDSFTFINSLIYHAAEPQAVVTKRHVLSSVSKLFDPLGLISPIIVKSKIFMQSLWRQSLGWDDPLPDDSLKQWETLHSELLNVNQISIPRWVLTNKSSEFELHGFSDASTQAMAACIYIRVFHENGAHVNLLISKTKLAPIQTLTVPRLELCAALMLAKLSNSLIQDLNLHHQVVHLWTDSTITLTWLNSSPHLWGTFVSHRVAEAQRLLPSGNWHHIDGLCNPSDLASRGISMNNLMESDLWWHGPEFLKSTYRQFHVSPAAECPINSCPELRKVNIHHVVPKESFDLLDNFSSYSQVFRATAWVLRAVYNFSARKFNSPLHKSSKLSLIEYLQAKFYVIRRIQKLEFSEDFHKMDSGKPLSNSSKLLKLNPFMDPVHKVLRVGGRLKYASVPTGFKYPIILPSNSLFSRLLIKHCHVKLTLHGGPQLTLSAVRREYWILQGLRSVTHSISRCQTCVRFKGNTLIQQMGDLPTPRVNLDMPFLHTGVDYAGPIKVRTTAGRGYRTTKGYICVFVCFATKAVHLEAVSNLDTARFLWSLRRFVDRRGLCSDIYSDQGRNFIGADSSLKSLLSSPEFNDSSFNYLNSRQIRWHFNPPGAPHFGGLWEAAVKAAKRHLSRVLGDRSLTYEELSTLLADIEACLNSRPLSRLTEDPDSLEILTPGHFLIGRSPLALPDDDVTIKPISDLHRWKMVKQLRVDFWKRWNRDYLANLQQRGRWVKPQKNIAVGDLVLIKSEVSPPAVWPRAIVTKVHPGADGLIRAVTLKTAKSEVQRPIHKLILLPVDDN